jgi:hypothetical protein
VAQCDVTDLEERILLLTLKLIGAENADTARSFLVVDTGLRALEQLEDVVNDNRLKVDLLLVVKVLGLQLDLKAQDELRDRRT